jgi:hypothetical protein
MYLFVALSFDGEDVTAGHALGNGHGHFSLFLLDLAALTNLAAAALGEDLSHSLALLALPLYLLIHAWTHLHHSYCCPLPLAPRTLFDSLAALPLAAATDPGSLYLQGKLSTFADGSEWHFK